MEIDPDNNDQLNTSIHQSELENEKAKAGYISLIAKKSIDNLLLDIDFDEDVEDSSMFLHDKKMVLIYINSYIEITCFLRIKIFV